METKKKQTKSPKVGTRQYDSEFKKSAVGLLTNGQSVQSVSESLGIGKALLYKWKAEQIVSSPEGALSVHAENTQLRKQLKEVEIERDILKKALAIFSRVT
jgi:transposase